MGEVLYPFGDVSPKGPNIPRAGFGLRPSSKLSALPEAAGAWSWLLRTDLPSQIEKASDLADSLSGLLADLARTSGKLKFHHLHRDAEQLSERLAHALAEAQS